MSDLRRQFDLSLLPSHSPPHLLQESFPVETQCQNGVLVRTTHDGSTFRTSATWRSRVLNSDVRSNPFQAGRLHQLFLDTWGRASESNLLDESADAPSVTRSPTK
jgi:hypothetical protein